MARVTVTNTQTSPYTVPAPIRKKLGAGATASYNGISMEEMEKSVPFKRAIDEGTIIVVVGMDPTIPDEIESQAQDYLVGRGANFRTDEFTNPPAADVNALKTSIATTATIRTFSGTGLNGVVGPLEMVPPRNPTITSTLNAHVTAVACVFSGYVRNEAGELVAQSVTINTTNGGGTTDAGDRAMSVVTSILVPAMGGGAGALEFGFGDMIGLAGVVKSRAGLIKAVREIEAGVVVTTGTYTTPAGSAVTGYVASNVPDAARDYAITYETV